MSAKLLVVNTQPGGYGEIITTRINHWAHQHNRAFGAKSEESVEVAVVNSLSDAESSIKRGGIKTVIFVAGNLLKEAREMEDRFCRDGLTIRVIVFVDSIVDEVLFLKTSWAQRPGIISTILS